MRSSWTDERVEAWIANLLRAGVLTASAVVLLGCALFLVRDGRAVVSFKTFTGAAANLRDVVDVVRSAASLQPKGVMQLGLLLLIATPVMRVLISSFAFARERDWLYVGLTLLVLALLCYSLFFGR